jgi:VanZ family protein
MRPKYWIPFICYTALIIFMSSLSQGVVSKYFSWADFVLHFLEYHFYGLTLSWLIMQDKEISEYKHYLIYIVVAGIILGSGDELYQSFTPSRISSINDVISDSVGVLVSLGSFRLAMNFGWINRWRTNA